MLSRFLAVVGFFAVQQSISVAQPKEETACTPRPGYTVADFAMPVPDVRLSNSVGAPTVLETLKKQFGVRTIIRYYDHHEESIPCKTLLPDETRALIASGFSLAVVFQHNNHRPQTYLDPERSTRDARRALELAEANGQPYGTTIYFGVDGPEAILIAMKEEWAKAGGKPMRDERKAWLREHKREAVIARYEAFLGYYREHFGSVEKIDDRSMLPFVRRYFQSIKNVFAAAEPGRTYEVGAYGSGLTCRELLRAKLVAKCWLANARSWPGYDFEKETEAGAPRWSLTQRVKTVCPIWHNPRSTDAVEFDLNRVNSARPDFGQWSTMRNGTRQVARPEKCTPL